VSRKLSLPVTMTLGVLLAVAWQLPAAAQPAPNAHPVGGQVVAGQASISSGPAMTTISQGSQRAAINWSSFSVGSQWSVNVQQPNSGALALMRVTGPDPTEIAGRITSNGGLIIVNAAGTVLYQGGTMDNASLVVSTADVSNQDFMAGHEIFGSPGIPGAAITWAGGSSTAPAGLTALLAPAVDVPGKITANGTRGAVDLLGAEGATLGSGGVVAITHQVSQAPTGHSSLVTLTGQVSAVGGTVRLISASASGIVQYGISSGGSAAAPGVGADTGTISVRASGAAVVVSGSLMAQGGTAGNGGLIGVDGSNGVLINPAARLNASGGTGGGVIAVGTTVTGATARSCTQLVAPRTGVAAGAQLNADATGNGPGGTIAAIATKTERFAGTASAKGGPAGGNGGFIELGAAAFTLTGMTDVSAPHGQPGTVFTHC
jgi:filamentous hemagglutinin family protein